MDLAEEAGGSSTYPADPAGARPRTTAIADLAGSDAEVVFVVRHETTIGSGKASRKS
jgi:hypothetical protein